MTAYNVSNVINDPNGVALAGVAVNIKLMPSGGFRLSDRAEMVREANTFTNIAGSWTISLESNLNITPAGSWYEILEKIPKANGGPRTWAIEVKNAAGFVADLLKP